MGCFPTRQVAGLLLHLLPLVASEDRSGRPRMGRISFGWLHQQTRTDDTVGIAGSLFLIEGSRSEAQAFACSATSCGRRRTIGPRPRDTITSTATSTSATRMPDSPTQMVAFDPLIARSKTFCATLFQTECSRIGGQMLPLCSRNWPWITPDAVAATRKSSAERAADGPAAYCPAKMSGVCQRAQIRPLVTIGAGTPASMSRVSM